MQVNKYYISTTNDIDAPIIEYVFYADAFTILSITYYRNLICTETSKAYTINNYLTEFRQLSLVELSLFKNEIETINIKYKRIGTKIGKL